MEVLLGFEIALWFFSAVLSVCVAIEIQDLIRAKRRNENTQAGWSAVMTSPMKERICGLSFLIYLMIGGAIWIHWGTPAAFEPFILVWQFLSSSKAVTGY